MSCNDLPIERLVAHLDDELSATERATVERHLADCAGCAAEADLLRRSGAMIRGLPRHEPGPEFTQRVLAAASAGTAPRGMLRRLWPAAAAAAVLAVVVGARLWWPGTSDTDGVLTAREEQAIAADLYVLANLEALEEAEAEELISLVEHLDLLEGVEPEVSGLFDAADDAEGG